MDQKKWLNRKKLFPLFVGAVALIFLFSFVKNNVTFVGGFPVYKKSKQPAAVPVESLPSPVKVFKVATVSFRDTLPALGTIKGFRDFELKFPVQGNIEYINFKPGERITQGDIIASLDQKEALLKLEYAKIELDKQQKLFELGSIIETKVKQSQLEYQSAKAELDKTNLIAPSDGYIGAVAFDRGAFVSPQDKIASFVDLKDVFVEFGVIEKDVAKIRESQNVELVVDSYPDQIFKGQVDSISPMVEGRTRTVEIRAKISNPDEKIKPGMFGRVNVLVYEKDQALVIPASAFKKKEDQYTVFLVHPDEPETAEQPMDEAPRVSKRKKSKDVAPEAAPEEPKNQMAVLELRNIEIEYATPDAVEIKEGLEEGDLIVVDAEQDLQDKGKVEITETQEGIF